MIWDKEASETCAASSSSRRSASTTRTPSSRFTPREIEPPLPEDGQAPDVPTLVIAGELDDITTAAEGKQVADLFPNSEYFEARNGGHVVSLYDSHGSAAKEIRKFLRRTIST
jgi:pimeloyl-ACP methyl ester carboxylesterase